jgi:hypothetical protein
MAPYEALYGRQCRTSLFWSQTGESQAFGPEVLKDAEKQVQMVRESLKIAQSRQKSYADKRRRDLSFEIGDFVYLKVSPTRGTPRFKVKGKLAPRYVGPFKIVDRRGEVAYQLEFHHSYQTCMMYFTCCNLRNVCEFQRNNYPWKGSTWEVI